MARDRLADAPLSSSELNDWELHGWLLVESFISPADADATTAEIRSKGFPELREFEPAVDRSQFDLMATFPFPSSAANAIATAPKLAEMARQLLRDHRVQLYQAQLWLKLGGWAEYEQTHHRDYAKNTMLTPRDAAGRCDFVSFIIYLTDVDASSGPTAMVSRMLTRELPLEPARFLPHERPDLYEREQRVLATRGSAVFYAGDTFHRACTLAVDSSRLVLKGAIRRAEATWVDYVHGLRIGFEPEWSSFVDKASSQQMSFLMGANASDRVAHARSHRYTAESDADV